MTEHQNVDNAEIAKFEAIAERWWDLEGEFKPLHEINPLRLDFIADKTKGFLITSLNKKLNAFKACV